MTITDDPTTDAVESNSTTDNSTPAQLNTAKVPLRSGLAERTNAVVALLMLALGGVAVRDALVASNQLSGMSFSGWVLSFIDGLGAGPWLWAVAVAAALLCLVFLKAAVTPPPKAGVPVKVSESAWLSRSGIERLVDDRVNQVGGVLEAKVRMRGKTLRISARCTDKSEQMKTAIVTAAVPVVSNLTDSVRVVAKIKSSGESQ